LRGMKGLDNQFSTCEVHMSESVMSWILVGCVASETNIILGLTDCQ